MDPDSPVLGNEVQASAAAADEAIGSLGVEDAKSVEALQTLASALHRDGSFALAKAVQGHVVCQLMGDVGKGHPDSQAAHSKLMLMVQTALMFTALMQPRSADPAVAEGHKLLRAWKEEGDLLSWNALYAFVAKHMDDPELAPLRAFVFDFERVNMMVRSPSEATFHTAELKDEKQEAQVEAMMERFPKVYDYLMFGYASRYEDDDE